MKCRMLNKFLTDDYLKWIKPLLYPPEEQILLNHTRLSNAGIRIKDRELVREKFHLSYRRLYNILWRLEALTRLYELEVAAGLI